MPPVTIAVTLLERQRTRQGERDLFPGCVATFNGWGGWGAAEREAAPHLTFQDRDNGVKINSQAPVALLASLDSQFLSLPALGTERVPSGQAELPPCSPGWGGGSTGGPFTSGHACPTTTGQLGDSLQPAALLFIL